MFRAAFITNGLRQAWPGERPRSTRGEENAPSLLPLPVFPFWLLDSLIPSI